MAKRFYDTVSVEQDADGYFVCLDGRGLKTPGKKPIRVPSEAVAAQMAAEWNAVEDEIEPMTMPVTRLANVACEGVAQRRAELIKDIRNYASTDLLSYRAPDPQDYVARQAAAWNPWTQWAAARGIVLHTTDSLMAIDQPEESLNAVMRESEKLSDFALTLAAHLTAVYGSAVLALAVMEGALDPAEGFDLSRLDETYRAEIWGLDEDDEAQRAALRAETEILGNLAKVL